MQIELSESFLAAIDQAAKERGLTNDQFIAWALDQAVSNAPQLATGTPGPAMQRNAQKEIAARSVYTPGILAEMLRAMAKYPRPFASQMEGYAVIQAQLDRLWIAVKANQWGHARSAATKLGAMVLRFLVDC